MKALLVRFVREDEGQDLIEYALLAAGISLAAIGGISAIGGALNSKYQSDRRGRQRRKLNPTAGGGLGLLHPRPRPSKLEINTQAIRAQAFA